MFRQSCSRRDTRLYTIYGNELVIIDSRNRLTLRSKIDDPSLNFNGISCLLFVSFLFSFFFFSFFFFLFTTFRLTESREKNKERRFSKQSFIYSTCTDSFPFFPSIIRFATVYFYLPLYSDTCCC